MGAGAPAPGNGCVPPTANLWVASGRAISDDNRGTAGLQRCDSRGQRQSTGCWPSAKAAACTGPCGSNCGDMAADKYKAIRQDTNHGNSSEPVRQVFVKMETQYTQAIRVHSWHDPVSSIKTCIREKWGVLIGQQRLVFAGKPLTHNEWSVAYYGIGACSTLEIPGPVRGGMPAKSDAKKGDIAMTPAETSPAAANSSLLAWAKWVQGPYQTLLKSAHFEQQLDDWELGFLEALTEQEVPEGAIAAMTTQAGVALDVGEATRAMVTYKGRRHL